MSGRYEFDDEYWSEISAEGKKSACGQKERALT
jgi:hypothetical protein